MGEQDMEYGTSGEPQITGTKQETDKKCPDCGGVMDFNPSNGKMTCPYCGHEETIQVENKQFVAQELDFDLAEDLSSSDWGTVTKSVICKSCGAETVYDGNEIASECPYCGSNQVMEAYDQNTMAPGGVVLFKISAQEAAEKFKSWIGRKFFCPKLAKDSARPKAFKGLYLPFWTFDANTDSSYTGEYGIDREYEDSEGNKKTETEWYRTVGYHQESFDDVLVCASAKQNESMLKGLEPYDTQQAVEYQPEYMAGFMAERYSVKMKTAWEKAKDIMSNIIKDHITNRIRRENHADHTRNVNTMTEYADVTYKYLLLPVWISSFQYKGKVYHFMINGQTGKVSGDTPISWIKVAIVTIVVAAVIGIIFWLTRDETEAAVLASQMSMIASFKI